MKKNIKFLWFTIICLAPILFTLLVDRLGGLERIEALTIDGRHKVANPNHKFTDKLLIVDVDENSLSTYASNKAFGRWPWKRNVYGPIVEYIASGSPKLIIFDIMFFEASDEDLPLIDVTMNTGIVSHAINFNDEENMSSELLFAYNKEVPENILNLKLNLQNPDSLNLKPSNILLFPRASKIEMNKDGSKRNIVLGDLANNIHSVSYKSESDGVARKYFPVQRYRNNFYFPSLALKGFLSYYPDTKIIARSDELSLESSYINRRLKIKNGAYQLQYYSAQEVDNVPRISIANIVESIRMLDAGETNDPTKLPANPEIFTNKIIILGTSAASTSDTRLTPYGDKPGFIYHATMLSNLLEGHFINIIPEWIGYLIIIFIVPSCVALILFSQRMALRIVIPLLLFILYPFISAILFKYEIQLPMGEFLTAYPIAFFGSLAFLTLTEGAERRKYTKVLSNMVDPTIVSEALNDLEALKRGGEKEITAFFSDVASFSTISEQLNSTDLAALLNEYLSAMTIILKQNKGTLDKYIGDAVVGIFGAPLDRKEHFLEAARASLQMIEKLEELKIYWKANNLYCTDAQDMNVRIGLNSGLAKVGFMGTENLASYTMMGDTVNLAARLEAAGKDYGVSILISENTYKRVKDDMFTRELDAVRVKGKNEPVRIFELISLKGQSPDNIVQAAELYEEAFGLYLNKNWAKAIKLFKESKEAKGKKDKAVDQLIERCEFYEKNPPPENWDGVFTRTHK